MTYVPAISVRSLTHCYGSRVALNDVTFSISAGEIFAFLGPNGGGKTTLFRILSTLMPLQQGAVSVFGYSVLGELFPVRRLIGVVFQSPSLDKKLTVDENVATQAALYGLRGSTFRARRDEVLEHLGLLDRRSDRVETLSGGLRRRADLAKALIHRPRLLLMDEPSTGLDPGARSDLWNYLRRLREQFQTTIVLTSHLLDEADRADQIAILHAGDIVASGEPRALRASVGGNSITVETDDAETLSRQINQRWQCNATVVDGDVRVSCRDNTAWAAHLVSEFPQQIKSVKIGRPTLEDVFICKTGHRFWNDAQEGSQVVERRETASASRGSR
jgi:ABC-2 type transport system ATP-binding protein